MFLLLYIITALMLFGFTLIQPIHILSWKCLLILSPALQNTFTIQANTMNPDQGSSLIRVHIVCNIGHQRTNTLKQMRQQMTIVVNGRENRSFKRKEFKNSNTYIIIFPYMSEFPTMLHLGNLSSVRKVNSQVTANWVRPHSAMGSESDCLSRDH